MRLVIPLLVSLMACEPIPSRGILQQAPATSASPARTGTAPVAEGATGTSTGSFDFEGEDRQEDEGTADAADAEEQDPVDLQADLFGIDPDELSVPEPVPEPAVAAPPVVQPGLPMPIWEPDQPLDGGWGMRLIATLHDVQPPRAVIVTADGQELVVQPGQMLPDQRLVVLAVGQDAVQIARVTPQGFYAKVETETVISLAPAP